MSARQPSVRWPLYVTGWAFIAGMQAVRNGDWFMVVLAVLMVPACWGFFASERAS